MSVHWDVQPEPAAGRYILPATLLTGPGLDDLMYTVCEDLANSILDGDTRADLWADYLLRMANLRGAVADDVDAKTRERFEGDVADAWDALAEELPNTLRLVMAEARLVAQLLDEACGRVGIEAP